MFDGRPSLARIVNLMHNVVHLLVACLSASPHHYLHQNELYTVMYPIFVHCYLDFVIRGKVEAGMFSIMPLCTHVCGRRFTGPSFTRCAHQSLTLVVDAVPQAVRSWQATLSSTNSTITAN